jgi:cyclase
MLTRRIIPCLDVLNGRVVKGRKFENLIDVGDAVAFASRYSAEGADELVVLDISATLEGRKPFYHIVEQIAEHVSIPLTVGGGIRSIDEIVTLLHCGADKVSLNTILTEDPDILPIAADRVGTQALVAALDVKRAANGKDSPRWVIKTKSGTLYTELDALQWAETVVQRGAGELLVTSIDHDGMKEGYDVEFLSLLSTRVKVPVIASGGAGSKKHILDALVRGKADAVLAASIFHFNEIPIPKLKQYLAGMGVPMRL